MTLNTFVESNFERLTGIAPQPEDVKRIALVLDDVLSDLETCIASQGEIFDLDVDSFPRYFQQLQRQAPGGRHD